MSNEFHLFYPYHAGSLVAASHLFKLFFLKALQEMRYHEAFEGILCMDALEHVCPEDWPLVLSNFQRALKPQGYCYFTVEVADEQDIADAFLRGKRLGLPLV